MIPFADNDVNARAGERTMTVRTVRTLMASALLAAVVPAPLAAQAPVSEQAKLAQALAEQKAAGEVDTVIAEAEKTAKISTSTAIQKLEAAKLSLDLATGIGTTKREELIKKLDAKLSAYRPKDSGARPNLDPRMAEVKLSVRQKYENDLTEAQEVAVGLKKYADLKDSGRPEEARRTLGLLAAKYPRNPFLDAAGMQSYTAEQVRADANFQKRFADAMLKNHRDVIASATPAVGDIQFMNRDEWQMLRELRGKQDKIQMTEKEEQILKSLETAVSLNLQDRPFEEALQDLSNKINQELFIDKQSLKDAGLDLTRPISFKGNVSARTALRAILQSNQLTFLVKGEMIQVVTLERAERELSTRSYYLGDLVMGTGPFGNAIQFGPVASYQQAVQNAEQIVKAIKDSIDPRAWKDNGGACSVTFHMASLSVVVKASTEVHALMGSSLSASPPKK
jgi:hypothetical protein